MLENIKHRMKSDLGASLSVEQVLFVALAVFAVLAVAKFIMEPLAESAQGIGGEIEKMNPQSTP